MTFLLKQLDEEYSGELEINANSFFQEAKEMNNDILLMLLNHNNNTKIKSVIRLNV